MRIKARTRAMQSEGTTLFNHALSGPKRPITLVRGEGVYVFDDQSNKYLDAIGGVGVVNVGHGNPAIVQAIANQARTLAFNYSAHTDSRPRQELASLLQRWAPTGMGDTKTLFCSGGAEANEAALKIAYQYHWEGGNLSKRKVIGRWQSYHGNTLGALSMSGRTEWRRVHSALLADFPHIGPPYCYRCPWKLSYPSCNLVCADELRRMICQEGPENIAAFIAEPIIGTSLSAVVPPVDYYREIRNICDQYDVLFIADEVMSGIGRTGLNWGIDHWGVTPDIITTAKGIAGGYAPLGATILSQQIWERIASGTQKLKHSYTFGGNPLSCAAGVAVLKYIEEHALVARARVMGDKLLRELHLALDDLPWVGDVRGKGLFIGIEIVAERQDKRAFSTLCGISQRIEDIALKNGLLILSGVTGLMDGSGGDHFELLPPYTIEDNDLDCIVTILRKSVIEALNGLPSEA